MSHIRQTYTRQEERHMYFSTASVASIQNELQGRIDGTVTLATPITKPVEKRMNPELTQKALEIVKNRNTKSKLKRPATGTRESFELSMKENDRVLAEMRALTEAMKEQTKRTHEMARQSQSVWAA